MALIVLSAGCVILRGHVQVTSFHRNVLIMFLVYWYAGIVGFIMSFFAPVDHVVWVQDFQQILYLALFFLLTFHVLNTPKRWSIFVFSILSFLALKNGYIFFQSLGGIGKIVGDWAIRSSQNSEFTYFPMLFFPLAIIFLKNKSFAAKAATAVVLFVYLFNALIGVVRTVWVMLIIGGIVLFMNLDRPTRKRALLWGTAFVICALTAISVILPRFITMAFGYKFLSIFEWSILGDRSNATRTLEIINVFSYSYNHFSFLQGRGLGGWWDDSVRRLLPDLGSGFMYKKHFYGTHIFALTQYLKLGLIGTGVYWYAVVGMLRDIHQNSMHIDSTSWKHWVIIGLGVGIVSALVSCADFVRTFLMIGVALGICASGFVLFSSPPNTISSGG